MRGHCCVRGCCLAPILISAGVLEGGVVLVGVSWAEPIGFALIGFGVVGLIAVRAGRRIDATAIAPSAAVPGVLVRVTGAVAPPSPHREGAVSRLCP